ncbi:MULTISPECIES: ATP-binding protein [unclassified Bradyrhizobium]|uniref:AlbA family DNA-binding domain-containing protein n=1 Tax=Bradyrhizobium TaxID=374 RepID=UPI0029168ED4|nr:MULTISPECIES: ATP-binding protein [unclassified Bradyrhizobium]
MLALPADFTELVQFDADTGAVTSREGKRLEFKEGFISADLSDYTKVLASFANALGGVIIFGVSNKPRNIIGAQDMTDEANWANRLRDDFDPELPFTIREYTVGKATLYAVGVNPCLHKPVICKRTRSKVAEDKKAGKKDVGVIQEGAIYYRYAGQTRTIGFAELHNMLVERETQYLRKMMETLQVIQKVGLENAGIVDMSAPHSRIFMSKETAKGLAFIDKGQIVQEAGAPAYVVMGNVDLQQVVHAPLEDEDKNIPTEAARMLSAVVRDVYGIPRIHPPQVTLLLRHLKIDGDNVHCVVEKKMGRKYITRAGLKAVEDFIRKNPGEAIQVFGSRASKNAYLLGKLKSMPAQDIYIPDEAVVLVTEPAAEPTEASK